MRTFVKLILVLALAAGCARHDTGASGVPADKRLTDLTAEETAKVCDWRNEQLGGYGHTTRCGDAESMEADEDRAACMAKAAALKKDCAATVSQLEACTQAVVQAPCDLAKWLRLDSCRAALTCSKN